MLLFSIKFKAIVMLFALFLMCFVYMAIQEKELEAIAITGTVLIAIVLLLASLGLVFTEYVSPNIVAMDFWGNASDNIKNLLSAGIDEETRTLTVHGDVFDYARGYITDTFVIGGVVHGIETQYMVAPWGGTYIYTLYTGNMDYTGISADLYNLATKYSEINYGAYNLKFVHSGWYDRLYINDTDYSNWDNNGSRFLDVYYYESEISQNIYLSASYVNIFTGDDPNVDFAFFYNPATDLLYPVIIKSYGGYNAYVLRRLGDNSIYKADDAYPISEEVNVIIDGTIVLDDEYSITAPLPIPYDIGQIIGQTAGEVIAQEWADVMTIDRYIELYGSIPVSVVADFSGEIPTEGSFTWTKLSIPMVGLTDKFPFSIPFDLRDALVGLSATPEVPILSQNLTLAGIDGGDLTLDFTPFQPLANIIKWGLLLLFNIGLILTTRRIIRG